MIDPLNVSIGNRIKIDSITLETGVIYTGEWLNRMKDGYGEQLWPDGAKYEGEWKLNKSSGKGKLTHADGDVYEGEWEDNKANGKGIYKHKNGSIFEGYWKNDKQVIFISDLIYEKVFSSMDQDMKNGWMEYGMMEIIKMERRVDQENKDLEMVPHMKVILKTTISMVKEYTSGQKERNIQDNGKKI